MKGNYVALKLKTLTNPCLRCFYNAVFRRDRYRIIYFHALIDNFGFIYDMNYWLIKSEPNAYSWNDLVKLGRDHWDGVRNYQARNNIMEMKNGDQCFFYHSVSGKCIVGIAEVVREYYPDPTTDDPRWYVMDIAPVRMLKKPVTLEQVKVDKRLDQMMLVTHSRLSVMPVKKEEFDVIIELSEQ